MDIQIQDYLSESPISVTMTLPDGATLKQVRKTLESGHSLLIVNGVARQDDYTLSPEDMILVMPLLEGG